jgi:hypothetical protein
LFVFTHCAKNSPCRYNKNPAATKINFGTIWSLTSARQVLRTVYFGILGHFDFFLAGFGGIYPDKLPECRLWRTSRPSITTHLPPVTISVLSLIFALSRLDSP